MDAVVAAKTAALAAIAHMRPGAASQVSRTVFFDFFSFLKNTRRHCAHAAPRRVAGVTNCTLYIFCSYHYYILIFFFFLSTRRHCAHAAWRRVAGVTNCVLRIFSFFEKHAPPLPNAAWRRVAGVTNCALRIFLNPNFLNPYFAYPKFIHEVKVNHKRLGGTKDTVNLYPYLFFLNPYFPWF